MTETTHFEPDGPFRRADALCAGLTRRQLQGRSYRSVARGVLLPRDRPLDLVARCSAMRLILPSQVMFSHHTAAELHRVPAPRDALIHVSLVCPYEPRIAGVVAHRVLELPDAHLVQGLRVTSPGRTFVDLAGRLDLPALVAAGDALARMTGSTEDLQMAIDAGTKRRGIRLAREALRYVDLRADSAPESHLRLLLTQAGLPPDLVNEEIVDEFGRRIAKPDIGYWVQLALEYEGRHHQLDPRQWESDIQRDAAYQDADWHLIKVTAAMLYQRPHQLVEQVAQVLRRRGWRAR